MKKAILCMVMMWLSALMAIAQITSMKGIVVSAEDGEPVIGATVTVTGTQKRVATDMEGRFSFSNLTSSDKTITVTYVGMETATVKIEPEVRVVLQTQVDMLDEVVVVAFGKQKREAFTGSATVIKSDDLTKSQVNNPITGLQGKVPGLTMIDTNDPSKSSTINIRGLSSINAGTEPLIIVDGLVFNGNWRDINPADVDNISVLKDAASNALYGARGANGVIMITTKSAQKGRTKVTLDAKWGVNTDAKVDYDVIDNAGEYYEAHYLALKNYYMRSGGMTEAAAHLQANNMMITNDDTQGGLGYIVYSVPSGQTLIGRSGKLNPNATLGNKLTYDGQTYTLTPDSWRDYGLRNGFRQEYNLTLSGGGEKYSVYMSLGYLDNDGICFGSSLKRYTARLKTDYQAYSWLKVGANTSYVNSEVNAMSSAFSACHSIAPIYPLFLRDGDGVIMTDEHGAMYDYGDGTNAGLVRPVLKQYNSLQSDRLDTSQSTNNSANFSGYAIADFLNDFRLTINGSVYLTETRSGSSTNPYYGYSQKTNGTVSTYHYRYLTTNFQQLLNWSHDFGHNHVEVLLGHEYNRYSTTQLGGSKSFVAMYTQNLELNGAIVNGSMSGSKTMVNREGYFIRAQYDYASRYFASASFRRDGSSYFHPNHRWGNFWSVGGAWILSKEEWFPKNPLLSMLKYKISYGEQGNDAIGSFKYTDYYTISNSDNQVALAFSTKGNPNITWEKNGALNTGFEFEAFNYRLSGSIEYYWRKTSDMLTYSETPSSLGYSTYYANIGDMVNQGIEFQLNATLIRSRNFNWNVNLNGSWEKNRITKLPDDKHQIEIDGHWGYQGSYLFYGEGLPLYSWYIQEYAGPNSNGEPSWITNSVENADLDANGNPVTTADGRYVTSTYEKADYQLAGSALPTFYGGFGTTVTAWGFDLTANFTYSLGGKKLDSGYATLMYAPYSSHVGYNIHRDALKGWSEETPTAYLPRWQYGDTQNGYTSTLYLTNANSLSFRTLQIGYTLPQTLVQKHHLPTMRVYFSVDNVAYWTKRKGFDPRSVRSTYDDTGYSPMRTFVGGINLTF